ncbi:hypothetical protein SVIOM74S_09677 [Streptomyces violarus]
MAIALSMIVATTSLTPRVTLRTPAMPAQKAPVRTAVRSSSGTWRAAGRATWAPTIAASIAPSWYWPSTPMLNRFIRKPMATESAAM